MSNFGKRLLIANGLAAPENNDQSLVYGTATPAVASMVPTGKDSAYYDTEMGRLKAEAMGKKGSMVPDAIYNIFSGLLGIGSPIKQNTDAVLARQYALEAAKADAEKDAKDAALKASAPGRIADAYSLMNDAERTSEAWGKADALLQKRRGTNMATELPLPRADAYRAAVDKLSGVAGDEGAAKALEGISKEYNSRQMLQTLARMKTKSSVPVSDALYDAEALADPSIYKTASATEDRFANQMQYGQMQNSFQMAEAEKRAAERRAAADAAAARRAEEDAKPKPKPSETGMKVLPMDGINKISNMNRASKSLATLKTRMSNLAQWKRNPGIGQALGFTRPFDQEVALIRQSAVSLIPTIARGVYGEVGVLTDSDVKRYSAVLPGMGDKPEVADAMIAGLFADAENAREEALNAYKLAGYDVSGFERMEEVEDEAPVPPPKKKKPGDKIPPAKTDLRNKYNY